MFDDNFEPAPRMNKSHNHVYIIVGLTLACFILLFLLLGSKFGLFGITGNIVSDAGQTGTTSGITGTGAGNTGVSGLQGSEGTEAQLSAKKDQSGSTNDNSQSSNTLSSNSVSSTKKSSAVDSFFSTTNTPSTQNPQTSDAERTVDDSSSTLDPKIKDLHTSSQLKNIPKLNRDVQMKELTLDFATLSSVMKVNNANLEFSNLQNPTVLIKDFSGTLILDTSGISLNGIINRIEVNGVSVYSSNNLKLTTGMLDFKKAVLSDIFLDEFSISSTDGTLNVADKLQYTLQQDKLRLFNFKGVVSVDKTNEKPASFDGIAQGVEVNGDLLKVQVQ